MGKPERKVAEQQAGSSKLGLAPLISKPGKAPAANKQPITKMPATQGVNLASLRQMLERQLRELNNRLDQDAAKLEKQFASSRSLLDKSAQGHSAQANKVGQTGCMHCPSVGLSNNNSSSSYQQQQAARCR